ncbi:hypothetical protein HPULCUR_011267 [Helicostylum pulchrum]|uniref:Uncharacterized protein n=1 Tax=Helicostylum pulchrum TaxID=562976 RepID=A0ABP9YFK6_9FUNG
MNYFPSPPNSPYLGTFSHQQQEHVMCGDCNKTLGSDWFCSDCHKKCNSCNRFLGQDEYCTRCWSFDPKNQQFSRKLNKYYSSSSFIPDCLNTTSEFSGLPTPSNSTGSTEPKLLTRSFTYNI